MRCNENVRFVFYLDTFTNFKWVSHQKVKKMDNHHTNIAAEQLLLLICYFELYKLYWNKNIAPCCKKFYLCWHLGFIFFIKDLFYHGFIHGFILFIYHGFILFIYHRFILSQIYSHHGFILFIYHGFILFMLTSHPTAKMFIFIYASPQWWRCEGPAAAAEGPWSGRCAAAGPPGSCSPAASAAAPLGPSGDSALGKASSL